MIRFINAIASIFGFEIRRLEPNKKYISWHDGVLDEAKSDLKIDMDALQEKYQKRYLNISVTVEGELIDPLEII